MNDLRQVAQQALEALESVLCDPEGKCCIDGSDADRAVVDKELAALRAALAQAEPEHETVELEWRWYNDESGWLQSDLMHPLGGGMQDGQEVKLYTRQQQDTAPQQAEPVQEPVAWRYWAQEHKYWKYWDKTDEPSRVPCHDEEPLYTAPPQRKPLTEEELQKVLYSVATSIDAPSVVMTHWPLVARAVEARLAEPVQRNHYRNLWPERNFCPRCGKRLSSDGIHTCTPPQTKCSHCASPLFAARQCRVCGRKNEQTLGIKEES